jgi:hypothetical protein
MKHAGLLFSGVFFGIALAGFAAAEAPPSESGPMLRFTATTANVTGAPDNIRIDLFRWSTEEERDKLMAAWELKPEAIARGRGAAGRGGSARGGAGAARAGRSGARAGRGGGRGGPSAAPPTPEGELAQALKEASTIGYLWSSEAAGYAIRYAGKVALPDGSDRIVLLTDRRLGEANGLWRAPDATAPSAYDFSVIELRVNAKGSGEGKLSLSGKVAPDAAAGIVALTDYDSLPVVFTAVKQTTPAAQGAHAKP